MKQASLSLSRQAVTDIVCHRNFVKLLDFEAEELQALLALAGRLKAAKKNRTEHKYLEDRQIVLIFEKDSTRTRCSFEVAARDQGGRMSPISGRKDHRSATRSPSKTPPVSSGVSTTRLSSAATLRRMSRRSPHMLVYRSITASPMSFTRPRSSLTSSR